MYPKLFDLGPIPVYSYGLMLGIAFLIGSFLITKELKRKNIDENVGFTLTLIAIITGIIGSKVFYVIEEWNFGNGVPIKNLLGSDLLSPAGLTFYGGLFFSIVSVIAYCKMKKLSVMMIFDSMTPSITIGYAVARIGCHLSGDGCYGVAVNGTFWEFLGMEYSKGIVPTAPGELALPTPLFEMGAGLILFLFLWSIRKKMSYNGQLFYIYLVFSGIFRLTVEFIRRNPKVIFDLSQAQLISVGMIIIGIALLILFKNKVSKTSN